MEQEENERLKQKLNFALEAAQQVIQDAQETNVCPCPPILPLLPLTHNYLLAEQHHQRVRGSYLPP